MTTVRNFWDSTLDEAWAILAALAGHWFVSREDRVILAAVRVIGSGRARVRQPRAAAEASIVNMLAFGLRRAASSVYL